MDKLFNGIERKENSFCSTIATMTSNFLDIPIELFQSKTRKREVVYARQLAMLLCCHFTKASLVTIGNYIGEVDHATVLHGKKTISNLYDTDRKVKKEVEDIVSIIKIDLIKSKLSYFVCSFCGNENIVTKLYVNINTKEIIEEYTHTYQSCFCSKCSAFTTVLPYKIYIDKINDKKEQGLSTQEEIQYLEKELNL